MSAKIDGIKNLISDNNTLEFYVDYFKATPKGKNHNCIFCDSSDGVSYNNKNNQVKCFSCGESSDIIGLIEKSEKKNFINALKVAAEYFGIECSLDETVVETAEEIAKRKADFAKKQKLLQEKKELQEKELSQKKENAIKNMTALAPSLAKNYDDNIFSLHEEFDTLFPNFTDTLQSYLSLYVGYDLIHNSFTITNRLLDGTTFNIKYREKFEYDKELKAYTQNRMKGKWISYPYSTTYAFPYEAYKDFSKTDDIVIITEGEKDALNLLALGINAITLGGVATSWENHKEILKDKIVYIWFDNDNAGYLNAIKRFNEIQDIAKDIFIILFFHIDRTLENKYDITDFIIDKNISSKKEIIKAITYSSYKLTTTLVKDIEEYTDLDLKEFYTNQESLSFYDIKQRWKEKDKNGGLVYITTPKGEKEIQGQDELLDAFKEAKRKKLFTITKEVLLERLPNTKIEEEEKELKTFQENMKILNTILSHAPDLYKHYSQQHINDVVTAFINMTKKTDNTFAEYNDLLYVWTGTHYKIVDYRKDAPLKFIANEWMPLAKVDAKKITTDFTKKVFEDIKLRSQSLDELKQYQEDKRVFNFINGTIIITKNGKYSFKNIHSKKDGATNILDFEYNPNAKAPKWQEFLNRVIPDKDDQKTLMEFIGYCFIPSHRFESFLFLYGKTGANGKSVITDVIRSFFGEENISSLNLQNLEGHQLTGLVDKFVNIGSELDTKGLNKGQMSVLKALTSTNDSIPIDPKHSQPFDLLSKDQPKLITNGNKKPNAHDMDDGVFRRMLLIEFIEEIKDDEKIRDLSERFHDEKSGIFNMALEHLQELVKRGYFTKSEKLKENIDQYKDQQNNVRRYAKENILKEDGIIVPKVLLYAHYVSYCEEKGYRPQSQNNFISAICEQVKGVKDVGQLRRNVPNLDMDRPRFLENIYVKDSDVVSFMYNKKEIETKNINYNKNTQIVVYLQEDDVYDK